MSDPEPRRRAGDDDREWRGRTDEKLNRILDEIKEMKQANVTRVEFKPVQLIAYGLVAVILVTVVGAILVNAGVGT